MLSVDVGRQSKCDWRHSFATVRLSFCNWPIEAGEVPLDVPAPETSLGPESQWNHGQMMLLGATAFAMRR